MLPLALAVLLLPSAASAAPAKAPPAEIAVVVHNLSAGRVTVDAGGGRRRKGQDRLELRPKQVARLTLAPRPRSRSEISLAITRREGRQTSHANLTTTVWLSHGRVVDVGTGGVSDPDHILYHTYSTALRPAGLAGYLEAARSAYASSGVVQDTPWKGARVLETADVGGLEGYLRGGPPPDLLELQTPEGESLSSQARSWLQAPRSGANIYLFVAGNADRGATVDHLAHDRPVLAFPTKGTDQQAGRAVDGYVGIGDDAWMVTSSRASFDSFWEVDLEQPRSLGGVMAVAGRGPGGAGLEGASLFLTSERLSPLAGLERARKSLGEDDIELPLYGSEALTQIDLHGLTARFLRIQRPGEMGPVGLRELLVFPAHHGVSGALDNGKVPWITLGGRAYQVGVGPHGQTQVISRDGQLWAYGGSPDKPSFERLPAMKGFGSRVAIMPDGAPWTLNRAGAVQRYLAGTGWETLPDPEVGVVDLASSATGHLVVGGAKGLAGWDHGEARWASLCEDPVTEVALVPTGPARGIHDPRPSALGVLAVTPEGGLRLYPNVLEARSNRSWQWREVRKGRDVLEPESAQDVASNAVGQVVVLTPPRNGRRQVMRWSAGGEFPDDGEELTWTTWPSGLSAIALAPAGDPVGPGKRQRVVALSGFRRVLATRPKP
jgi:hypothetical protein